MIIYCPRSTNVIYSIKAYAFNILNQNNIIISFCWYPPKAFSFALYKPTFTSLSFDFLAWAANFPSSLILTEKKTLLHPTPTTPVAETRWKLQLFNCKSYYTISPFATHTHNTAWIARYNSVPLPRHFYYYHLHQHHHQFASPPVGVVEQPASSSITIFPGCGALSNTNTTPIGWRNVALEVEQIVDDCCVALWFNSFVCNFEEMNLSSEIRAKFSDDAKTQTKCTLKNHGSITSEKRNLF